MFGDVFLKGALLLSIQARLAFALPFLQSVLCAGQCRRQARRNQPLNNISSGGTRATIVFARIPELAPGDLLWGGPFSQLSHFGAFSVEVPKGEPFSSGSFGQLSFGSTLLDPPMWRIPPKRRPPFGQGQGLIRTWQAFNRSSP